MHMGDLTRCMKDGEFDLPMIQIIEQNVLGTFVEQSFQSTDQLEVIIKDNVIALHNFSMLL